MSVVARTRKSGTTYYAVFTWQGRPVWERVGADRREAERVERRRKAEVARGTYVPPAESRAITVGQAARDWLDRRTVRSAANERALLTRHVLARPACAAFVAMPIADVRPVDVQGVVVGLRSVVSESTGRPLAPKTIALIYGALRTMFRDAVFGDLVQRDPCRLQPGTISKTPTKPRSAYDRAAVATLLTHPAIPKPSRIWIALALLTGMREGEVCGRRWRDLDTESTPLPCLTVATQYEDQALKTDRPRRVPVHPVLAGALELWRREGWELVHLRAPRPADFIVPQIGGSAHTKSSAYKAWRRACDAAGVTNLSLHSTRHTFLTFARRGGARPDVIERVTHNATGTMVDHYTHWEWEPLCDAVASLRLDANVDARAIYSGRLAPAPGLEPGRPVDDSRKRAESREPAASRRTSDSAGFDAAAASRAAHQRPALRRVARETVAAALAGDESAALRGLAKLARCTRQRPATRREREALSRFVGGAS
jgi:integrase